MLESVETRPDLDPASFFDEHYPEVFRFVASATGASAADVEDLVQETLLQAWRGRAQFRGEASLLTWVLGIARNLARLRLRTLETRGAHDRALRALADLETKAIPPDLLEDAELRRRVRRALDDLDPSQAEALLRRYADGWSVRRIAEESGESEKAVESRLHRAREALREKLKE
jgi:RNA polymerase sigma-70 factor (ECF subfamily)